VSEALGNLAGSVADLGADGKNDLETAVLLETLGVDDETARRYGFADVFGLAAALSPEIECRNAHPELTVAMPAFNTERYIGEALRSVLDQEGVDFEVIVVDDGSTDGTARVVSSLADPRVRLVHNPVNRGIGWCHQHVLELSRAPFITHVDSDDLLVPGALRAILAFARLHPRAAQVHAFHFAVDEDGRANRNQWRLRRREFLSRRRGMDYRAALMELGTVNNGLRTYRKALLHLAGGFDPRLSGSEDLEAGLRIVERFEIRGLPQFLYVIRHHSRRTSPPLQARAPSREKPAGRPGARPRCLGGSPAQRSLARKTPAGTPSAVPRAGSMCRPRRSRPDQQPATQHSRPRARRVLSVEVPE
jgi:hypothetical protein